MLHIYKKHVASIPKFFPTAVHYELRDAALYPFPERHPDTVALLCIWLQYELIPYSRSYQVTYCLNKHGYRIVETFESKLEKNVDAWLSEIRSNSSM